MALEVRQLWRIPWTKDQVTPLMANGVLCTTAGVRDTVAAIVAATGETI